MAFVSVLAPRRSVQDVERFLSAYRAFRRENPLPEEWTDDLSEVIEATTNPHSEPLLRFEKRKWDGALVIEADLSIPGRVVCWVTDAGGDPLKGQEATPIFQMLFGTLVDLKTDLEVDDLEDEADAPNASGSDSSRPDEPFETHYILNESTGQ